MTKFEDEQKRNPLRAIGWTVLAVLIVPPLIYSMGPEGPVKKDDMVFSTGQHRAYFEDQTQYQAGGYRGYCVLQPRDQLLVLKSAAARRDKTYLLQNVGTTKQRFPLCPSQSKVILYDHQITLKPDLWGGVQDAVTRLFSSD